MKRTGEATEQAVLVQAEPIELCQFVKFAGLAATGGDAKQLIKAGKVLLNGTVETQKAKKLHGGDKVTVGRDCRVVQVG